MSGSHSVLVGRGRQAAAVARTGDTVTVEGAQVCTIFKGLGTLRLVLLLRVHRTHTHLKHLTVICCTLRTNLTWVKATCVFAAPRQQTLAEPVIIGALGAGVSWVGATDHGVASLTGGIELAGWRPAAPPKEVPRAEIVRGACAASRCSNPPCPVCSELPPVRSRLSV